MPPPPPPTSLKKVGVCVCVWCKYVMTPLLPLHSPPLSPPPLSFPVSLLPTLHSTASPDPHQSDGKLPGAPEEAEPSQRAGLRVRSDTAVWKSLQTGETCGQQGVCGCEDVRVEDVVFGCEGGGCGVWV